MSFQEAASQILPELFYIASLSLSIFQVDGSTRVHMMLILSSEDVHVSVAPIFLRPRGLLRHAMEYFCA